MEFLPNLHGGEREREREREANLADQLTTSHFYDHINA
jgi:hypothetical protein